MRDNVLNRLEAEVTAYRAHLVSGEFTAEQIVEQSYQFVMKQGSYATYRKKFTGIGKFTKDIHIGKRTFTIEHSKEEGGGASWKFASCRENQ